MDATTGYKVNRITSSKTLTASYLNSEVRIYGDLGEHAKYQLGEARSFQLSGWYRDARGLHLQLIAGKTDRKVYDVLDEAKVGLAKYDDQVAAKEARKN